MEADYIPITLELVEDSLGLLAALTKNVRERQMADLFGERRRDPMREIETGAIAFDARLYDTECEDGCCACCEEDHGTFRDLTGRSA